MKIVDKLTVLGFRHQMGLGQLQRLSEQELFISLVDQGQIGREGVVDSGLGQVSISGNTAEGEFLSRGQKTLYKYRFVKEDGMWRLDLTALLRIAGQSMTAAVSKLGVTEDEFIANMLEEISGKPVSEDIWEPLVKEQARLTTVWSGARERH